MTPALVVDSIAALRERLIARRPQGRTIGFVPTMGALHRGHARLIEEARRGCDDVVVSIFVNALQFDRADDFDRYPRTMDADVALCADLGVDTVFAPAHSDMYPAAPECRIDVGRLADHLCGRHRPGHFTGMATVVMKLLQVVQPHRAYFGEKDAQQLAIIRRMVRDLNVPVGIAGVPTVREPDGLALSSRNRHLSPQQRMQAVALFRALQEAERLILAGERDVALIISAVTATVPLENGIRLEYLEAVDPEELQPVVRVNGPVLMAGAMWVETTRLIDNIRCEEP